MSRLVAASAVSAAILLTLVTPSPALAQGAGEHWVGTWATAVVGRAVRPPAGRGGGPAIVPQGPAIVPQGPAIAPQGPAIAPQGPAIAPPAQGPQGGPAAAPAQPAPPINFNNQTLREIVHVSIGGDRVRVVLSNEFGDAPLAIGAAHVALREGGAATRAGSDRALSFAGKSGTSIPAGAVVFSDPVSLTVPPLSDLAVSVYLPGDTAAGTSPLTLHAGANQTNYVSAAGDHTGDVELQTATTVPSWYFLSRVEVVAPDSVGAIVALGDSITDGARTTADTNSRWPDDLARRLAQAGVTMGVLNAGIGGNRILQDGAGVSALARFNRDVASQTGVTHLLFLEGVNDIRNNLALTADDLIAAHRQIIDRAHARGLKVIGGTVTAFEGSAPVAAYTPETEGKRQALNAWIRTSRAYDAVVDFDAVTRDPMRQTQLLEQYQSGDHLHPNDAGYRLMGDAVSLDFFRPSARAAAPSSR